ncbi:hypothetical protein MAR_020570 [Mya arenaria]|uniref:Uncharacterized protein n=1 Tax=Mya arenaria TaxID=6604 RepID=A0ABY7EDG7_MYAAR|nr:hypothetical protein MAR_020570 [Mya arenaria]
MAAILMTEGFDTEKYNATEEKDTIYLTTACTFHVSLSDMQIVWYTYDNTILRLLDETRMGHSMTPFNSASVCSDECDTISAYRFTFGLNITDQEQGYTDVFIETEIFHPDYKNKPLTWRSSNTFRVKDSSPKTSISWVALSFIVLASVLVTVLIEEAIYLFKEAILLRNDTEILQKLSFKDCNTTSEQPDEKKNEQSRDIYTHQHREKHEQSLTGKVCLGFVQGGKKRQNRDTWEHSQSERAIETCNVFQGKKRIIFETLGYTANRMWTFPISRYMILNSNRCLLYRLHQNIGPT